MDEFVRCEIIAIQKGKIHLQKGGDKKNIGLLSAELSAIMIKDKPQVVNETLISP